MSGSLLTLGANRSRLFRTCRPSSIFGHMNMYMFLYIPVPVYIYSVQNDDYQSNHYLPQKLKWACLVPPLLLLPRFARRALIKSIHRRTEPNCGHTLTVFSLR